MQWWVWIIIIVVIALVIWLIVWIVAKNQNSLGKRCSKDAQCGDTKGVANHCSPDPANPTISYCQLGGINTGDPGATCSKSSPGCTGSSTCQADGTCSALAKLTNGTTCDPAKPDQCSSGVCTPDGLTGKCGKAKGDTCTNSNQCQSNNCSIATGQNSGLCTVASPAGSVCNNSADCTLGLNCSGGFCQTSGAIPGQNGYFCNPSSPSCDTANSYKCVTQSGGTSLCQISGSAENGTKCTLDSECISNSCSFLNNDVSYCQPVGTNSGTPGAYCPTYGTSGCTTPNYKCSQPVKGDINGTCRQIASNGDGSSGQYCTTDNDCVSGSCAITNPSQPTFKFCGIEPGGACSQDNNQCSTGNCVCNTNRACFCDNGNTSGLEFYSTCSPNVSTCKSFNICTKIYPNTTTQTQCLYPAYQGSNSFGPNVCDGVSKTCAPGFGCLVASGWCGGNPNIPTDSGAHCVSGKSTSPAQPFGYISVYNISTKIWTSWGSTTGYIGNDPNPNKNNPVKLKFTKIVSSTSKGNVGVPTLWGLDPAVGLFYNTGPVNGTNTDWRLAPPNATGDAGVDSTTRGAIKERFVTVKLLYNYNCSGNLIGSGTAHTFQQTIADFSVDSDGIAWVAYNSIQTCIKTGDSTLNSGKAAPVFYYYVDLTATDLIPADYAAGTKNASSNPSGAIYVDRKDNSLASNGLTTVISMDVIGTITPILSKGKRLPYMTVLGRIYNNVAYQPFTLNSFGDSGYAFNLVSGSNNFNPVPAGTQIRFVKTPNSNSQNSAVTYNYKFVDKSNLVMTNGLAIPSKIPYSISTDGKAIGSAPANKGLVVTADGIAPNGYNAANQNLVEISDFCHVYTQSPFKNGVSFAPDPTGTTIITTTYMIARNSGGNYNLYYLPNLLTNGIVTTTQGFANILPYNAAILPGYFDSSCRISADHNNLFVYSNIVCQ